MRFSFVLVAVAASIASVSASDTAAEGCAFFCLHSRQCGGCPRPACNIFFCVRDWTTCLLLNKFYRRPSSGDLGRGVICHGGVCLATLAGGTLIISLHVQYRFSRKPGFSTRLCWAKCTVVKSHLLFATGLRGLVGRLPCQGLADSAAEVTPSHRIEHLFNQRSDLFTSSHNAVFVRPRCLDCFDSISICQ